jgi:Protein of unknown function (DUF3551)
MRVLRFALTAAALAGAAFAGLLLNAGDAAADGYTTTHPFCVKGAFDQIVDCTHVSLQECQLSAQGMGYCFANPYYAGLSEGPAPRGLRARR